MTPIKQYHTYDKQNASLVILKLSVYDDDLFLWYGSPTKDV